MTRPRHGLAGRSADDGCMTIHTTGTKAGAGQEPARFRTRRILEPEIRDASLQSIPTLSPLASSFGVWRPGRLPGALRTLRRYIGRHAVAFHRRRPGPGGRPPPGDLHPRLGPHRPVARTRGIRRLVASTGGQSRPDRAPAHPRDHHRGFRPPGRPLTALALRRPGPGTGHRGPARTGPPGAGAVPPGRTDPRGHRGNHEHHAGHFQGAASSCPATARCRWRR